MTVLKSIVVCLALANVVYFLWTHGVANSQEAPVATQAPVATLQLASEVPAGARPSAADGSAAAESSGLSGSSSAAAALNEGTLAAASPNVKRCITVGPFRDVAEAAHAASTLRGGGYDPRQRVAEGEVWAGVWVYLPLPASQSASDQLLDKLKAAGIDDALEMPGPAAGPVISLGLFSEPKRAQVRIAQAKTLGFTPELADRKSTGNVYWIDIDLKPSDGILNPAELQGETGRISRLEVKACQNPAASS